MLAYFYKIFSFFVARKEENGLTRYNVWIIILVKILWAFNIAISIDTTILYNLY